MTFKTSLASHSSSTTLSFIAIDDGLERSLKKPPRLRQATPNHTNKRLLSTQAITLPAEDKIALITGQDCAHQALEENERTRVNPSHEYSQRLPSLTKGLPVANQLSKEAVFLTRKTALSQILTVDPVLLRNFDLVPCVNHKAFMSIHFKIVDINLTVTEKFYSIHSTKRTRTTG